MPVTSLPSAYAMRLTKTKTVRVPVDFWKEYAKLVNDASHDTKNRYFLRLRTGPQLADLLPVGTTEKNVKKGAFVSGATIGYKKYISENEFRLLHGDKIRTPPKRGRPLGSKNKNSKTATAKECAKLTTKRAKESPRPPYDADACRDMSMKGNNGANWESRPSRSGSPYYKWYKKGSSLTKKGDKKGSRKKRSATTKVAQKGPR